MSKKRVVLQAQRPRFDEGLRSLAKIFARDRAREPDKSRSVSNAPSDGETAGLRKSQLRRSRRTGSCAIACQSTYDELLTHRACGARYPRSAIRHDHVRKHTQTERDIAGGDVYGSNLQFPYHSDGEESAPDGSSAFEGGAKLSPLLRAKRVYANNIVIVLYRSLSVFKYTDIEVLFYFVEHCLKCFKRYVIAALWDKDNKNVQCRMYISASWYSRESSPTLP